jgi:CubicO group peptidase (beta-lactamase class C family)
MVRVNPSRVDRLVAQQSEPENFSGVVHVTRGEEVLFAKAYGNAIRAESIPNRLDTRFQIASGCKVFTAVAVCQLVERGLIAFGTRLRDCVDADLSGLSADITIAHLLTHTSGITSYFEEDVDADYEALWCDVPMYNIRRPKDFLPLFQRKKMKFAPGARFDYNDGGFLLLGLAVEAVTGIDFSHYIERSVFAPAGMDDSGYFATDRLPERTAYAYIKDPDGTWRTNFFAVPIVGGPDGGAYTTAPDMARFWRALTGHELLREETTGIMLKPHVATVDDPPSTHYGYGVWIEKTGEKIRKYFVEGLDPGVAMRSAFYLEGDLVLTIMGNTARATWPLYRKIEQELGL